MLWSILGAIPLPYRLLLVVTAGASIYVGGFASGHHMADQSAKVASLARDKADLQSQVASYAQLIKERDATVLRLSAVSEQALERADDADKRELQLGQQLNAYTATLTASPACFLSPADTSGLRSIGTPKRHAHRPAPRATNTPSDAPE